MKKNVSINELKKWASNYSNNQDLPFITNSAVIRLQELEDFIADIKSQNADSIRIYFISFEPNEIPTQKITVNGETPEGCVWLDAGRGYTQASIAIVPTKNFTRDEQYIFSADDIVRENEITTLMPGTENEGTALNPPPRKGQVKVTG